MNTVTEYQIFKFLSENNYFFAMLLCTAAFILQAVRLFSRNDASLIAWHMAVLLPLSLHFLFEHEGAITPSISGQVTFDYLSQLSLSLFILAASLFILRAWVAEYYRGKKRP